MQHAGTQSESEDENDFSVVSESKSSRSPKNKFAKKGLIEWTDEHSATLIEKISEVITQSLLNNTAVFLERVGLIVPSRETKQKIYDPALARTSHTEEQPAKNAPSPTVLVRAETNILAQFEKCEELTQVHRDDYEHILETSELTRLVYPKLPLTISLDYTPEAIKGIIRNLLREFRREIIVQGFSKKFESIGEFFSLHNRQGSSERDWFAGADIFMTPRFRCVVHASAAREYERPILRDSLEPFESLWEAPLASWEVAPVQELEKIGYHISKKELSLDAPEHFHLSVFGKRNSHGNVTHLVFVSHGLRSLAVALGTKLGFGTECVLQVAVNDTLREEIKRGEIDSLSTSRWAASIFSLAWTLMRGSSSGCLRSGVGISCEDVPLHVQAGKSSGPRMVLATDFRLLPGAHCVQDGLFQYMSLIGITDGEVRFAQKYSSSQLISLLKRKNLDQVTHLGRTCVTSTSCFAQTI